MCALSLKPSLQDEYLFWGAAGFADVLAKVVERSFQNLKLIIYNPDKHKPIQLVNNDPMAEPNSQPAEETTTGYESLDQQALIAKHSEFWFEDGSVVVVVEDQYFRVHQSILARHSEVFANMFTMPQPSDQESLASCPVMRLNDNLNDFVDLLKVMYHPFHFDLLPADADLNTLITFISGALKLSTKYIMRQVRQKCIVVLQSKFPSSIQGCDTLLSSKYLYPPGAIVRAIPLARENVVPEILPWAYYISTHLPTDDLLKDDSLSWRDKALCLAGKERLWEAQKTLTHSFLFTFDRSPGCISLCNQGCQLDRQTWKGLEQLRKSPHPLEPYTDWQSINTCKKCKDLMEKLHKVGREKLWEILPSIFELGSWKELREDQMRG